MPELPEVQTIKNDLEKVIINKKIVETIVNRKSVVKEPAVDKFRSLLNGSKIIEIIRRGKLLVIKIKNNKNQTFYLAVHLRMTGQLVYGRLDPKARVALRLSDKKYLCYNDQRCLGELRVVDDWTRLNVVFNMGPEPLEKEFSLARFSSDIKKHTTKIKPLLLDQHFVAGIGNIYACEALFLSKIDPQRRANRLKEQEIKLLHKNIKKVLNKAIKCRGSSFSNYRDGRGEKGTFTEHFYVYSRKGKDCRVCGNEIKRIAVAGRGTFFCDKCQK